VLELSPCRFKKQRKKGEYGAGGQRYWGKGVWGTAPEEPRGKQKVFNVGGNSKKINKEKHKIGAQSDHGKWQVGFSFTTGGI